MRDKSPLWPPPPVVPRQSHKGQRSISREEEALFRHTPKLIYNGRRLLAHLAKMGSTSPRTIYLPSSGGYTSTRIVPEVSSLTLLGCDFTSTYFVT